MEVLLSLAAAGLIGSADFLGGLAGRKGHVVAVALWMQIVGVAALVVLAPLAGSPTAQDLAWGAVAGVGTGLGVIALYRGFAVSRVGVVAPTSAVAAAVLATAVGVVAGDRPTGSDWMGIVLGVGAIGLVSRIPEEHLDRPVGPGILLGVAAGAGFALGYVAFSRTGVDSGLWPLLPARVMGSLLTAAVALVAGRRLLPTRGAWPAVVAAGLISIVGNFSFIAATHIGMLAVVAVLTSLYPAATVGLARIFFRERLYRSQLAGLALAITAVALIAI